jgi:hypothetical protein
LLAMKVLYDRCAVSVEFLVCTSCQQAQTVEIKSDDQRKRIIVVQTTVIIYFGNSTISPNSIDLHKSQ